MDFATITALSKASARAVGFLGVRRAWLSSMTAARHAAVTAGRLERFSKALGLSEHALFQAVLADAQAAGLDTADAQAAFEETFLLTRSFDPSSKNQLKEFGRLRRRITKNLGRNREKRFFQASSGVTGALMAAITWDLTDDATHYSTSNRQILIGPWLTVREWPLIN